MSSSITLRGVQLLPFYRRRIPKYPIYWKGDPQLRVFLPQFWMRLLKPEFDVPTNQVHFEVHPQMSEFDIKNYLEKIYKVPVLSVQTKIIRGADIKHKTKDFVQAREPDKKLAYLVLAEGQTFSFPDIFKNKLAPAQKQLKDYEKSQREMKAGEQKSWERSTVPPWFRF
ncbi:54S ribosomal protein L23, mitochondrial [Bulinus truncatus]|nr:54S ribosomal protein L23, mitochondrial [Bulinus truncatus]